MTEPVVLEGRLSVEAALMGGNRDVHAIYIRRGKPRRDTARLERWAAEAGVPVERVATDFIDTHTGGRTHGGVIALAGERRFLTLERLLPEDGTAFVVMLDGVEDPFNLGHALRSLYAAGVDGVVLPPRNWTSAAGVVARASAGAGELVRLAVVESAASAAEFYHVRGLTVACTAKRQAVPLYEADLTGPLFLVIGGEKRGITRSFLEQADLLLAVPYGRRFRASLTTASVSAVAAFEVMRQRRYHSPG